VSRGVLGPARLVHPFPSALDAVVTLGLALLARAPADRAALLAMAMLGIQFSIGALNDLVDKPADRIAGRAKPLVEGRISVRAARAVVAVTGTTGLILAALAGPFAALVALAGYAIGLVYDLRLKASPWSWLPFAAGIPLLPVFAWVGATGRLPGPILWLAAVGVLGGAALAVANALADADRDATSGTATIATVLGRSRSVRLGVLLSLAAGGVAMTSVVTLAGVVAGTWLAGAGAVLLAVGVVLGLRGDLQAAWEVQAIGIGILAIGWVAAITTVGLV
jgi:4-hydroxybenzoate polyprenyltransferase